MINFDLTDEQQLLEQSVREWGAARNRPAHPGRRSQASFDRERVLGGMAKLGLLGILRAAGVRRRRHGLRVPRPGQRRARIRGHVAARDHVGPRRPQLPDAAGVGHRRSEAALSRAAGAGAQDRRLRSHRAGRRQRCARDPDDRGEEGRAATSSTARSRGFRWPTSPTTSWSSPGPIWRRRSSAIRPA